MKRLKNQSGSILLLVLVVAPIAAILFFSLIDMALLSRTQSLINRNVVSYSAVLDAAIDYTQYAVKNHWCMNTTWERVTTGCDMNNPMNLERLILDPQTVRSYTRLNPGVTGLLLKRIDGIINIATIPSTSPLFKVVKNMDVTGGTPLIGRIEISVERIDNADFPRRGRESYLQITASLVAANVNTSFFRNFTKLSARSKVMVTPRELNYFSLIVPHDLRLDGSPAGTGDFSIPPGAGQGISFESPVYVNGDIHVPTATSSINVAATFTSKVVLGANTASGGGGRIMAGGAPLSQPSGGYKDSLYTSMNGFGGFKKGFDIDDSRDPGLDVFAGLVIPPAVSIASQEKCVDYNEVKSSLERTKFSDLAIKQVNFAPSAGVDTADDVYTFHMGLTDGNMFLLQDSKPYIRGATYGSSLSSYNGKTDMRIKVTIGTGVPTPAVPNGRTVEFVLRQGIRATMPMTDYSGAGLNPKLLIEVLPFEITAGDGKFQPHLRILKVTAQGKKSQIGPIEIKVRAFDVGSWSGRDRRVEEVVPTNPDFTLGKGHSMAGSIHFATTTNSMLLTTKNPLAPPVTAAGYVKIDEDKRLLTSGDDQLRGQYRQPNGDPILSPPGPAENFDYAQVITDCHSPHLATSGSSFGTATWNTDFTPETRHTWHFAPDATVITPQVQSFYSLFFGGPSAFVIPNTAPPSAAGPTPVDTKSPFLVKSIVGKCQIPATTTFVAGFLVCDRLDISARGQPLLLIGTFIAKELNIDPSAVAAGITFRSIYHPQSTADLRAKKVLRDNFGGDCPSITDPAAPPIWWPELDPVDYTKLRSCSVISLRDQANPFTWTKMEPDCGLDTTGAFMTCKNHPTSFLLAEISRESDLQ